MSNAIEDSIFDFVKAAIDAANEAEDPDHPSGNPLVGAALHDTIYSTITNDRGIQIDDGESDFAPSPGAETIEEFDGNVTLIIYRKLGKDERSERKQARSDALDLAKAVAKLFVDDPTMGNRVNDSRVLRCLRGWANIKSVPHCIMNLPLLVNDTGSN